MIGFLFAATCLVFMVLLALVFFRTRQATQARERQLWLGISRDLAHQFATPLSALMGWVDVLPNMSDRQAAWTAMNRDLDRLKLITARLGHIGAPAKFEVVPLEQIISEAVAYFQKKLPQGSRRIDLRVDVSAPVAVRVNRELILWAVEHLIKNSVDALGDQAGQIILRVGRRGKSAIMEIEDDGSGVEPGIRRKLFDPGFSSRRGARGFGLALAKQVIENDHQGRLRYLKTPSRRGATFRMELPQAN